jgi:hypothetical protein
MFFFLGPNVEDKNEDSSMSMYGQDEEWNEWEVEEMKKGKNEWHSEETDTMRNEWIKGHEINEQTKKWMERWINEWKMESWKKGLNK